LEIRRDPANIRARAGQFRPSAPDWICFQSFLWALCRPLGFL